MSDGLTGSKLMLYCLQKVMNADIPDVFVEWLALDRPALTKNDLWSFNDSKVTDVLDLWRWGVLMHVDLI